MLSDCSHDHGSYIHVTILYNLKMNNPTYKNQLIINDNIMLLFQTMLLLGITTGVTFNIMFVHRIVVLICEPY